MPDRIFRNEYSIVLILIRLYCEEEITMSTRSLYLEFQAIIVSSRCPTVQISLITHKTFKLTGDGKAYFVCNSLIAP